MTDEKEPKTDKALYLISMDERVNHLISGIGRLDDNITSQH